MFKSRDSNMREFGTPERVYYLVMQVMQNTQSRDELYHNLCMPDIYNQNNEDIFSYTLTNAEELGLVSIADGLVKSSVDINHVKDLASFRSYTADRAFEIADSIFSKTTNLFLAHAEQTLNCGRWTDYVKLFRDYGLDIGENSVLGWRFWASFFGIGYLCKTTILPNTFIRIADALQKQTELPSGLVETDRFTSWLKSRCPELKVCIDSRNANLAVSAGLRTLHKKGVLELISQPDAIQWILSPEYVSEISLVSHILIKG